MIGLAGVVGLFTYRHNPNMDRLTAFGLFSVTAMLICYALEKRTPGS
jgi:hypothetical protein